MLIFIAFAVSITFAVVEAVFLYSERNISEIIRIFLRNIFVIGTSCIAFQKFVLRIPHFIETPKLTGKQYISVILSSLTIGLLYELLFAVVKHVIVFEDEDLPKHKALTYTVKVLAVVLFFLGCAAYFGTIWERRPLEK